MTEKRFKHTFNGIGMQFISYDDKNVSMGTFADEESIDCIVDVLNELSDKIVQLNDENEQLKKENKTLANALTAYFESKTIAPNYDAR